MKLYRRLSRYLKPYRLHVLGGILTMLVAAILNVYIIPLVRDFSDAVAHRDLHLINLRVSEGIILYFLRGLFTFGQTYLITYASQKILIDMRVEIFDHLQHLSLDFYTKWRSGDIVSRITGDIGIMQGFLVSSFTEILPQAITLVGVFCYLLYLNFRLMIITLFVIPIFLYTINKFGENMRNIARSVQRKAADISSILYETLSGIRVVKSFTMESHETARFKKESEMSFRLAMKETKISATQKPIMNFMQILAMTLIIWFGSYEVVNGKLSGANLIAFFTGLALLIDPVLALSNTHLNAQKAWASAERVFEILDLAPTVQDALDAKPLGTIQGTVTFQNVSLAYEEKEGLVLKQIDLTVAPGEVIALVGPSGAGKTSFINLLCRFYDPTEGRILIDQQDLKTVTQYSLRSQIGIVPQEVVLFNGTVRDNIRYGNPNATESEILEALQHAHADVFIDRLPLKLDTLVGERGVRFSGGQRQRIAIARALLRNPKILILDEATSSLDSESERLIQAALKTLIQGRTTFIIAHRLSTIQFAHRIIVLDQGKMIEMGTHEALLAKADGLYHRLYTLQSNESTHS